MSSYFSIKKFMTIDVQSIKSSLWVDVDSEIPGLQTLPNEVISRCGLDGEDVKPRRVNTEMLDASWEGDIDSVACGQEIILCKGCMPTRERIEGCFGYHNWMAGNYRSDEKRIAAGKSPKWDIFRENYEAHLIAIKCAKDAAKVLGVNLK
jgi:hypothetical protein